MKSRIFSIPVLAIAVLLGCADRSSNTAAMGASAGPTQSRSMYCRDGAWVTPTDGCSMHGGVERDMTRQ